MSEANDRAYATPDLDPLSQLAIWYGTDKAPIVGHGYTAYYHSLFAFRCDRVRKVLEVGIDRGFSLLMWRAYFPSAEIYALDIEPSRLLYGVRIRSLACNQAVEDDLIEAARWAGDGFDLIVDDGSHRPADQILTARVLVPLLASNGVYIIEDVLDPAIIAPHVPGPSRIVSLDLARDPYNNLVVIGRQE